MSAGTVASDVSEFLADPCSFFGLSFTEMHSLSRERLAVLQREGVAARFAQQRERIPMVAKLAGRQGIESVGEVEDVVPLLFEHTMYKSYPLVLLERRQFDKLTVWLDKLTSVDLSGVDGSGCDSIDSWLDLLVAETELDLSHTSGTSGTMSFFPWSRRDLALKYLFRRIGDLQVFGEPPTPALLNDPIHYIGSAGRHRGRYAANQMSQGAEGHVHLRDPVPLSADLMWLAARLRLAAARGDASRVEVPQSLLARRAELEAYQAEAQARDELWLESIAALQGERVLWVGFAHDLYRFAEPRVARSERWTFAPGSALVLPGGTKGQTLPDDWLDTVGQFLDLRIVQGYGMTELSCLQMMCSHGRYHLQPWLIAFLLDPQTSQPLPRNGVQTGRAAFFDLLPTSHWGGLVTGDELTIDFDTPCACGANSAHIAPQITRLSDKNGGDDKITCAATPQAHAEAMQFLVGY